MMKPSATGNTRESVFLRPVTRRYGGRVFRSVTAGSATLCRLHGVTFIDGLEVLKGMSEADAQEQIFLFLFIHGFPERQGSGCQKDIGGARPPSDIPIPLRHLGPSAPQTPLRMTGAAGAEITSAEVDELLTALDLPKEEFLRRYLVPFAMTIPMGGLMGFIVEWLAEENQEVLASVFKVLKRLAPDGSPPEGEPPKA